MTLSITSLGITPPGIMGLTVTLKNDTKYNLKLQVDICLILGVIYAKCGYTKCMISIVHRYATCRYIMCHGAK